MLNQAQLRNLWLGMFALAVIGCYPPWREFGSVSEPLGFSSLFDPPRVDKSARDRGVTRIDVDLSRLAVEIFLGLSLTTALVLTASRSQQPDQTDKIQARAQAPATAKAVEPPLPPLNTVTVELPGEGLGDILVESEEDADYWEPLCRAQGTFYLPKNKRLQLELNKSRRVDLTLLKRIPANMLFSIDASDSKITDEDVKKLATSSHGLKELDLSGTPVSSTAMEHLKGLSLEKLWIDKTLVDDTCVPHLTGQGQLKKLSLEGTRLSELAQESLRKDLPSSTQIVV